MRELNEAKSGVVDLFLVYQFLRRLATPFKKWPAYQSGVINDVGEVIVKPKERDQKQNQSFKIFDLMILKLKRLLGKIPGGKTRIASYAAALYLIKESKLNKTEEQILAEDTNELYLGYLHEFKKLQYAEMLEDAPTNSAGSGAIAGMGIGGANDLKVSKKAANKYKRRNEKDAAALMKLMSRV